MQTSVESAMTSRSTLVRATAIHHSPTANAIHLMMYFSIPGTIRTHFLGVRYSSLYLAANSPTTMVGLQSATTPCGTSDGENGGLTKRTDLGSRFRICSSSDNLSSQSLPDLPGNTSRSTPFSGKSSMLRTYPTDGACGDIA